MFTKSYLVNSSLFKNTFCTSNIIIFCERVITTCSTGKLVECFFGIVTERCPGSNPNFIEFAQILTRDAFFLMSLTSSNQTHGLSLRRTRDERPEKYSYFSVDCDEVDIVWELSRIQHEELFTVSQLHKARSQQLKGRMSEKTKSSMIYTGNTNTCTPYIDLVTENTMSLEEKSSLKDVNLAMKSRPMKSSSDFYKRKYGTAPRILGIQGERRNIRETLICLAIFSNTYF